MPPANRSGNLLFAAFTNAETGTSAGSKFRSIFAELDDSDERRVVASRFGDLGRRANYEGWRDIFTSMESERRATG